VAAVESVDPGMGRRARLSRLMPGLISRNPTTRAAAHFLLATLGRVERHRFVIAMSVGLALAFAVPLGMSAVPLLDAPVGGRSGPIPAIPFCVTACLAVGLRFAAILPGDVRASWVFDVLAPDRWLARAGLWRVMFLIAVCPIHLAFLPIAWRAWG